MNNNRNNSNNNKMNINFLNGKTCNSNWVGVKKFSYGFNNGNNNNFQNNQYNNSNINNNMNNNNQFGNFNNNFGNNFQNNFTNNNMIQPQGQIQMINNFNLNYNQMLSQFLLILLSKNSINNNIYSEIQNLKNSKYIFFTQGLINIGSTCYMNSILQCLLHVNELVSYFINIYPKDFNNLNIINKYADSKGQISKAFFNVIKGMSNSVNYNNKYNRYNIFNSPNSYNSFSPDEIKKIIGKYNKQFKNFEANDSKDLISYLFQSMHEELNYLGNNSSIPFINKLFSKMENFCY